jgi:hypothetical protein
MFRSDSEIETLLSHENNRAVAIKIIGQGQDFRADRTPKSETRERLSLEAKTRIGVLASVIGVKATSELTGKNQSQVSNIKAGLTGSRGEDKPLKASLLPARNELQEKALSKADSFLEMLGVGQDLNDAVKTALVAEKIVNIYDKLAPKNALPIGATTNIVFYAPRQLETKDYPIIEVEAQNG